MQAPALRTLMELCKCEALSAETPCGLAHNRAFRLTLESVLKGGSKIGNVFIEEYARPFADVRYYTLWALTRIADEIRNEKDATAKDMIRDTIELLLQIRIPSEESGEEFGEWLIPPPEREVADDDEESSEDEEEKEDKPKAEMLQPGTKKRKAHQGRPSVPGGGKKKAPVKTLVAHQKIFGKAVANCLKLSLNPASYRQVLLWLPKYCIPHVLDPLQLADFLIDSYKQGGVISLLALESLFLLMTKYRLEYAGFYASLYQLLTPTTCYTKHRQRYFELTGLALSSIKIPASTLAAFLKRACLTALLSPPSGGLYGLALAFRQLQRHADLHTLIHKPPRPGQKHKKKKKGQQEVSEEEEEEKAFDVDEEDPEKANALNTSLWELTALKDHYYPAVSSMAKGFQNKINTKAVKLDVDDFTSLTYKVLFDQEVNRKKKLIPTTFVNPNKFLENNSAVGQAFLFA
mmetsp:Transcript_5726/g.7893  ORF Transcript_5726/g.7893 Transcript_5726/m.7893 type:complete len:462 (+) Transcript_5726:434-1819(+)